MKPCGLTGVLGVPVFADRKPGNPRSFFRPGASISPFEVRNHPMEELTMLPFNLTLNRLSHILGAGRRRGAMLRRNRRRPRIELLEGRTLLTAGAFDTSFGGTGLVSMQAAVSIDPQGLAVQQDLKTVVVGLQSPIAGISPFPNSLI